MTVDNHSSWYLYMIRCRGDFLYTGITIDVTRRFAEHQSQGPKCAKYLRGKGPLKVVYVEEIGSREEALRAEIKLKGQKKGICRICEKVTIGHIY